MLVLNEKPKRFLNAKRRTTLKPIVDNPKISKSLQKKLNKIFRGMYDETEELFNSDKETKQIIKGLRGIKEKYDRIANKYALSLAERWANETSSNNRNQLFNQLKDHLGVDRAYLLDSDEFSNVFDFNLIECVALIKSIPTEYLGKVAEALKREFNGEGQPEGRSLAGQIKEETGISTRRAKFIARDQTAKMNAQFNQVRQQDLGIEEYIWRTAGDQRVVGNPSGLFPKSNRVHGDHYSRNGKVFRWDTPPVDGHPGIPINCRCVALPIIDFSKLNLKKDY